MPNPLTFMPPMLTPSSPKTSPTGSIPLAAVGGDGTYTISVYDNQSGGSLLVTGPSTCTWTAGPQTGMDTLLVTDGQGTTSTRDVVVMAGPTLASMRGDAKERVDLVNSTHITDAEWNKWINAGYYELYDRLVTAYDNDYNLADPYPFLTDGVTERYLLPPDFYKLKGVDVQVAGNNSGWMTIPKVNFGERNKYAMPYQIYYGIRTNLHYRLSDKYIWFLPIPTGGQWLRIHYVPRLSKLENDTDVLDGISGWEEYVIVHACINARVKREEDSSDFRTQKADMGSRVDAIAENRDIANPGTITDTRSHDDWDGGGSNSGFGSM